MTITTIGLTKTHEKFNIDELIAKLKPDLLKEISLIGDPTILQEILDFLELKKKMKEMTRIYWNDLYDTLNNENLKEEREKERELYKSLIKLLRKLTKERRKHPWIGKENRTTFGLEEPAIKDLLNKSLFIEKVWLKEWIEKFNSQEIHLWRLEDKCVIFENNKLKYQERTWMWGLKERVN